MKFRTAIKYLNLVFYVYITTVNLKVIYLTIILKRLGKNDSLIMFNNIWFADNYQSRYIIVFISTAQPFTYIDNGIIFLLKK